MKEYSKLKGAESFDIAKGIAILCIILGHFSVPDIPDLLQRFCFSFHMPLFFILAGYFFRNGRSTEELIKTEAKRLLIPYLWCSFALIVFAILVNSVRNVPQSAEQAIIEWIGAAVYGSGNGYSEPFGIKSIGIIWVLPAMLWCLLLFNLCMKQKNPLVWILLFVAAGYCTKQYFWMPYSIQASLLCMAYLYFGYEVKEKKLLEHIEEKPYWIAVLFLLWAFYLAAGGGNLYLVGGAFGKGLLCDLFFSSVASLCVLYFSQLLDGKTNKIKQGLSFLGRNSLTILCIHLIELNNFPRSLTYTILVNHGLSGYLATFLIYIIKIAIAVFGTIAINYLTVQWKKRRVEKLQCIPRSNPPMDRQAYVLLGIALFFLLVGELPLTDSVRRVIFSFHIPLVFAAAGYLFGCEPSGKRLLWYGRMLISAYAACRIGYLAVQLWQSVLYSSGADSWMILKDWTTVSFWGLSNSSSILASVGNVGLIWLLPALLLTGILCGGIIRIRSWIVQALVSLLISITGIWLGRHVGFLPFSLDAAMACVPLFWIGCSLRRRDWIKEAGQPRWLAVLSLLWLILIKWNGIDLAARRYPYGIAGIICAGAACVMIILLINELTLPDILHGTLCWGGSHFLLLLGMHVIIQRLAPWGGASVEAPVTMQLLIELIILGTSGILFSLAGQAFMPFFEKKICVDRLYLLAFGLYLIRAVFDTTMFRFPWLVSFYQTVRILALVVVWYRVSQAKKCEWKRLLLSLMAAAVFCFSYTMTGYEFLFDLAIFIAGAAGMPSRKILKIYAACTAVIMYLALIASFTGVIPELVYRDGDLYKHSFGICYPTDFAAHLVYAVLTFWVLFQGFPSIATVVIMGGLTVLQLAFCGTQCSEIVMMLSIVSVLYVSVSGWISKRYRIPGKIIKGIDRCICLATAMCAAVIIALSMKYTADEPVLELINKALSGRLRLAQNAFEQYGMTLFGTAFEMVGNGSSIVYRTGYNFVDSSFCLILVRYGMLTLLVVLLMAFFIGIKAIKNGNRRVVFALALIAVHSMIEHHIIELAYNPFLLLAFCDMGDMRKAEEEHGRPAVWKKKGNLLRGMVYVASGVLLLWQAPGILTYGRTLVTLLRFDETQRQLWFILALLIVTAAAATLIKQVADIAASWRSGCQRNKKCLVTGSIAVILLSLAVGEWSIKKFGEKYNHTVEIGSRLLEAVEQESGNYRIYADDVPILYKRAGNRISNRVFPADGAASEKNVIMFTDKGEDISRLTGAGFQFGELSELEGIYTNSEVVIQLIEEQGIPMTKCYSVQKQVDLKNLALLNGLEMDENGALLVDGQERSLIYGPYDVIYGGIVEITFQLKLLSSSIAEGEVATVRFSSDFGKNVFERKPVNRTDFNENGECTVTIKRSIHSSEGVEFLVFAAGDTRLAVDSITYRKVEE